MPTRFEETLSSVRELQRSGAMQEEVDAVIKSNGYSIDRFDKAYDRYTKTGATPNDLDFGVGRMFAKAATLGASPHIEASLRSGDAESNLADLRDAEALSRKGNGKTAIAADLAGGLVGALPFARFMMAPGIAAQTGRGALVGSAEGATQGALDNDRNRLSGATQGGILGGGLGALAPAVIGAGQGIRKFGQGLTAKGAETNASEQGVRELSRNLNMDGLDEAELLRRAGQFEDPSNLSVAHLAGPAANATQFIRGMAQQARPNKIDVDEMLTNSVRDSMRQLPDEVTRRTGVPRLIDSEELAKFTATRRGNASNLYNDAYKNADELTDPAIQDFLKDPYVQKVLMPQAEALYARKGWKMPVYKTQVPDKFDPMTNQPLSFVTKETPYIDTKLFDTLKKADQQTNKVYQRGMLPPGEGDLIQKAITADFMSTVRNPAIEVARNANPAYGKALSQFSDDVKIEDAYELGAKLFKVDRPAEIAKDLAGMSKAEKDAFRAAGTEAYRSMIEKIPLNRSSQATIVADTPDKIARLKLLFDDPDQFAKYMTYLKKQEILAGTKNAMSRGSTTAANIKGDMALAEISPSAAGATMYGNFQPMIQQFLGRRFRDSARAPAEAVAESVTRHGLQSTGPRGIEKVFKIMRKVEEQDLARQLARARNANYLTGGLLGAHGAER